MRTYFLTGAEDFRCLASACPDSCCVGWDVVVDDETAERYRAMPGAFGRKLRETMCTDVDGDTIFRLRDGRCPFLQADDLCRVWRQCGEAMLPVTCRRFPRIVQEYDDFTEVCLSLSCPEAVRRLLTADEIAAPFPKTADDELRGLSVLRGEWMTMLQNEDVPFGTAVCHVLRDASNAQGVPFGEREPSDIKAFFERLTELDAMTDMFRACIQKPQPVPRLTRQTAENLCAYYLYRYVQQAVSDGDVLSKVQMMLSALTFAAFAPLTTAENVRLFSKEVEHSYDNMEKLNEWFWTDDAFSPETFAAVWNSVTL